MTTCTERRFDRTIRTVMWMDAFLSVAMVAVSVVAAPLVAVLGPPRAARLAIGLASIACAVLLAAFGAVTAVLLMVRMHEGDYLLPRNLYLPLPPGMRPVLVTERPAGFATGAADGAASRVRGRITNART